MSIYYVDATLGNDTYDGLYPAFVTGTNGPWQSVTKVNTISFSAGDSCLFKCGETWATQLKPASSGSSGNHITFGTYNKASGLRANLTKSVDINGKSYLTFNGPCLSGDRIWADSAEDYLYFYYCIIENTGSFGFVGAGAQDGIRFYNCVFSRNQRYHIYGGDAANIQARNCIFLSNQNTDEGAWYVGVGGNLDVDYCFINTQQTVVTTRVTDGGHNIFHTNPRIMAYPPTPVVAQKFVLTFDDNYIDEFETMVNGVFSTYGIKATLFVNPGTLTADQKTKCAAFVVAGHEVANHTWSHEDLTATQAFVVTSTNTNPTVDVDVATTTISLSCDEVANRVTYNWSGDKTITDLKTAVVGKGWTITNSVQNSKTRQNVLKLDCLADSAGAQVCPYTTLLDISAPDYKFWDHEINDAQDEIQTITGVRPTTMAYPYGFDSAGLTAWLPVYSDLHSARDVGGATPILSSVPIWKFIQREYQWTTASTEATVREYARRHWLYAINAPGYFLYYEHQTAAAFWTRIAYFINEIQSLGGSFCTHGELVTWIESDHTVSGTNWIKTYTVTGSNYIPLTGSPCIDAGTNVSLTEDIVATQVPKGLGVEMGAYEHKVGLDLFPCKSRRQVTLLEQ